MSIVYIEYWKITACSQSFYHNNGHFQYFAGNRNVACNYRLKTKKSAYKLCTVYSTYYLLQVVGEKVIKPNVIKTNLMSHQISAMLNENIVTAF